MLCCDFINRKRYQRHLPCTLLRDFKRSCSGEMEQKMGNECCCTQGYARLLWDASGPGARKLPAGHQSFTSPALGNPRATRFDLGAHMDGSQMRSSGLLRYCSLGNSPIQKGLQLQLTESHQVARKSTHKQRKTPRLRNCQPVHLSQKVFKSWSSGTHRI